MEKIIELIVDIDEKNTQYCNYKCKNLIFAEDEEHFFCDYFQEDLTYKIEDEKIFYDIKIVRNDYCLNMKIK